MKLVGTSVLAVQTTRLMVAWVWKASTLAQHFFRKVDSYCYTFCSICTDTGIKKKKA